jgi:thioesterase domain-containing protein
MNVNDRHVDSEYRAELEDRDDELVDRDFLLGQERHDDAEARAAMQAEDRALLAARAVRDAEVDPWPRYWLESA